VKLKIKKNPPKNTKKFTYNVQKFGVKAPTYTRQEREGKYHTN
jgi:hypothetical protein